MAGSNKQYLRIEGEAVHLVSERIERTVTLADLMEEVAREQGITTPILPAGCRMFCQQGDRSVFVIEQAPTTRQVVWSGLDGGKEAWKLAFPYILFVVVVRGQAVATNECRVFYRTSPLGNGDDNLMRTNLCNVYAHGGMCTGDMRVAGTTPAQKAEGFVTGFWRSRFNGDLYNDNFAPAAARIPQVNSLAAWEAASEQNPLFPLSTAWLPFENSLTDVVAGRC